MVDLTRGMLRVFAIGSVVFAIGCSGSSTTQQGSSTGVKSPETKAKMIAPDDHDHSHGPELSKEDQALAALQKVCPVSDEELGGMGTPVKLTVKGEAVFICCKSCEKSINADPDKYLEKVAALKKANSDN
jgi:hypothetical protein